MAQQAVAEGGQRLQLLVGVVESADERVLQRRAPARLRAIGAQGVTQLRQALSAHPGHQPVASLLDGRV